MTPEAPAPFSRDEWQAILVCIGSAGASAIELKDRDAATYGTELAMYAGMVVRRRSDPSCTMSWWPNWTPHQRIPSPRPRHSDLVGLSDCP